MIVIFWTKRTERNSEWNEYKVNASINKFVKKCAPGMKLQTKIGAADLRRDEMNQVNQMEMIRNNHDIIF